jgi:hypothetical protein
MTLQRPRDPEARAHEREIADYSHDYTVVLIHDPDDEPSETILGELDETFSNDVDASYAASDAAIPDVNIRAEVRTNTSDSEHSTVVHTSE